LLAQNLRALRGVWFPALSLTTIASRLAPTGGVMLCTSRNLWELACQRWRSDGQRIIGRFTAIASRLAPSNQVGSSVAVAHKKTPLISRWAAFFIAV